MPPPPQVHVICYDEAIRMAQTLGEDIRFFIAAAIDGEVVSEETLTEILCGAAAVYAVDAFFGAPVQLTGWTEHSLQPWPLPPY